MRKLHLRVDPARITPGQLAFLRSEAPQVLLAGGFGSGKTFALALKILQLKAINGRAPGLIVAQTWRQLWSVTIRRFMQVCKATLPKEYVPRVVDKQGECYLDFGDGAPVFLRSATDPGGYDGLDVGWAAGDEARHWTREAYNVFIGRVRVPCPLPQKVFASTPAMHWLSDEFNSGKADRHLITAPTRENLKHLAPTFITDLKLSYSRRLQRAILEGEFTVLEGAVYEAFDPTPTSPWAIDYEPAGALHRSHKHFLAVDPGYRRSSWFFIAERGPLDWVVYDQLQGESRSDWSCVEEVNGRGHPIDEIWTDPAANATQSALNLDTMAMLQGVKTRNKAPIRYITGPYRSVSFGVDKMRVLMGDPEGGLPIRLRFARQLLEQERGKARGFIRSHASYSYGEVKEGRPLSDEPVKDGLFDHDCDAGRYWGVGMWLSNPDLRQLDPTLKDAPRGYSQAAA